MNGWTKRIGFVFSVGVMSLVAGCASASGDAEVQSTNGDAEARSTSAALAARCTVQGSPPVTSGCAAQQYCRIEACTNSIPPSCFGSCQSRAPISKCSGAFNCLCGTPTCINGEWTCVGNCGPGGEEQ